MGKTTTSSSDEKYAVRNVLDERFALIMEQLGLRQIATNNIFQQYGFQSIVHVKWIEEYDRIAIFSIVGSDTLFEYRFLDHDRVSKYIRSPKNSKTATEHRFTSWDEGIRDLALTIIRLLTEAEQGIREVATQARNQAWRYEA